MGSSKSVTVGYRYYLGAHLVLCHGPADHINKIYADEKEAWSGYGADGSLTIDKPGLFGGDAREGGIAGDVDIMMGASDQTQNTYLQSQLGTDIPGFRGVVSAVLKQIYMGINPYLKPLAFNTQRIHISSDGEEQWYDEKAPIGSFDDAAIYFSLDGSGSMDEVTSNGDTRYENMVVAVQTALDQIGSLLDGVLNIDIHIVLFGASPDTNTSITRRNVDEADITALKNWLPAIPNFATYFPAGTSEAAAFFAGADADQEKIFIFVTDGEPNQGPPAVVAQDAQDNLNGISDLKQYAFNIDLTDTQYTAVLDNTPDDGVPVLDGGKPAHLANVIISTIAQQVDMNPAHIIRECLTDSTWGMGYLAADIDDDSFMAAADTLFNENMGMSLLWDKQIPIEDFVYDVIRHINAVLYLDREDGTFILKLIRDDYDVGALTTLDESNIQKVINYSRANELEAINSVNVIYHAADTDEKASVSADDIALFQSTGSVISTTIQYPGFSNRSIAAIAAKRDLRTLSSPLLNATILANREASSLNIGDVFKFEWPDYHDGFVVMRVQQIEFGDGKTNAVKIIASEDIFSTPDTALTGDEENGWVSPDSDPLNSDNQLVQEEPYYELVQEFGEVAVTSLLDDDNDLGFIYATATRPTGGLNATVYVDDGSGFSEDGTIDFCPYAVLSSPIDHTSTTVSFSVSEDLEVVPVGSIGQVDDEIVRIDAIDTGAGTITIGRGCLDTVPTLHTAGSVLYLFDEYAENDESQYTSGEDIDVKLLTNASNGQLSLADADTNTVSMSSRAIRPYPPGNLKFNTEFFPDHIIDSADVALTWAHRDRLQQTSGTVEDFEDGDIGPEAGQTYTVRVYGESDTLGHTETGISSTSYTYTSVQESSDFPGLGTIVNWTPEQITTDVWIDFSDAATVTTTGSGISNVADKSGNGNDFSQGTDTNRPAYTNTINGLNVATFDGGDEFLGASSPLIDTSQSIFILFSATSESSPGSLLGQWASGQTGRVVITTNQTDTGATDPGYLNPFYEDVADGTGPGGLLSDVFIDSGSTLIELVGDTGSENLDFLINGGAIDTATLSSVYNGVNTAIGSVSASQEANLYDGHVSEMVMVPGKVSQATRELIEGYLAHKWGIEGSLPALHPYKSSAPTAIVGDSRLNETLRFEVESSRDGYASSQKHDHSMTREGYGYFYGLNYGGPV